MSKRPSNAREAFGEFTPKLAELTGDVLFGPDVWQDPTLSPRDRSLVTITALIATYRPIELPGHVERALANGLKREEIIAVLTHLAFYAGWPAAMSALFIVREVFAKPET